MQGETIFIVLFVVATAVAIAVQRLAIPYTVALVFTGPRFGDAACLRSAAPDQGPAVQCLSAGVALRGCVLHRVQAILAKPPGH